MVEKVLVLRSCDKDLKSHGGFQWPSSGLVLAPDWNPKATCGNGLHGFMNGEGNGELANWDESAKWLVVEVDGDKIVNLKGKVKFPEGNVVFCGSRLDATNFLILRNPGKAVIGSTLTGGDRSTLTGGDRSTLTGGDESTLTGGDESTLTGGDRSTLTGGDESTLTGGYRSTLICKYYDVKQKRIRSSLIEIDGDVYTPSTPYVCVNGIWETFESPNQEKT